MDDSWTHKQEISKSIRGVTINGVWHWYGYRCAILSISYQTWSNWYCCHYNHRHHHSHSQPESSWIGIAWNGRFKWNSVVNSQKANTDCWAPLRKRICDKYFKLTVSGKQKSEIASMLTQRQSAKNYIYSYIYIDMNGISVNEHWTHRKYNVSVIWTTIQLTRGMCEWHVSI